MRNQKWQSVIGIILFCCSAVSAEPVKAPPAGPTVKPMAKPVAPAANPTNSQAATPSSAPAPVAEPLFKFSISYQQMKMDPKKSLPIVESELVKDAQDKIRLEVEARNYLGQGFEALGDFESAAKNYSKCRTLNKNTKEEATNISECSVALARIARYTSLRTEVSKLYEFRNDPSFLQSLRAQFFTELISHYSFERDFAKAKQLATEAEGLRLPMTALDEYFFKFQKAFMLVDSQDLANADAAIQQARMAANKLGAQAVAWVDLMEANHLIGKKDFVKAKTSYQKALSVINKRDFKFNAFWVQYLGLKLGFYLTDANLLNSSYKECLEIIRGTEAEKRFMILINSWVRLFKKTDITNEMASLKQLFGIDTNFAQEIAVAKSWQKPK